jgi:hypothetical protein
MPHIPTHPGPVPTPVWPNGPPSPTRSGTWRPPGPRVSPGLPLPKPGLYQTAAGTYEVIGSSPPAPPGVPGLPNIPSIPQSSTGFSTIFTDPQGNVVKVENADPTTILAKLGLLPPEQETPATGALGDIQKTLKGIPAGGGRQTRALGGTVPDLVAQQDPLVSFTNLLTSIFGPQGAQSLLRQLFADTQPLGDMPMGMRFR